MSRKSQEVQEIKGRVFVATDSRYVDPFTMTLNHGETFGVFDRQGDVVNLGKKLQGIFFEGSRHLSLLDFQLNCKRPLLLSSTIREDNDTLNVDLANEEFSIGDRIVPGGTIHIKKNKSVRNEAYNETLKFENFNSFEVLLSCELRLGADFKDVFELRGFYCPTEPGEVQVKQGTNELVFSSIGRDGIERRSRAIIDDPRATFCEDSIVFDILLSPGGESSINLKIDFEQRIASTSQTRITHETAGGTHLASLKKRLPEFKTNNTHFDHWVSRSSLDLMALMSRYNELIYPMAGVPWYNTPFGRDGLITAFQTLSFAPFIAKNVLKFLAINQSRQDDAQSDSEPGKILHEQRKGELANIGALPFKNYFGAADSTFLFIWLLGLYVKRSGDFELLEELWPNFSFALEWIDQYADQNGDGLFEYIKRNPNGLDNQCWKDSWDSVSHDNGELAQAPITMIEVQAYAYKAFVTASYLFELKNDLEQSKIYVKRSEQLREKFNSAFWMEDKKFFALALDKDNKQCKVISSNPGHAMSTGIFDQDKIKPLVDKLFSEELFTGWGIRTLGDKEKRFNPMSYHNGSIWPHDNSMIAYGLKRYGEIDHFHTLVEAMFETAQEVELARLPELFCGFTRVDNESPTLYPVSCSPQAWAAGVVYLLIHSMLGLSINSLEHRVIFNDPTLPKFLDQITIKGLEIGGGVFSFIVKRVSSTEATVEILQRPQNWKVSINK
ncbi:MAG: amylo-alpha-1,6-glucosidase [Bacteriovoracaceae bacterium]|nr:amylo-alpha-1,6-glucosidase [Bacteriovoracaceae bacterium]